MDFAAFFDYPGEEPAASTGDLVLLERLAPESWAKLLERTGVQRFSAGEVLVQEGDIQPALFIVVRGTLEVLTPDADGELKRIATIAPGSVFGEQAFFDGLPRSASVRAMTDGEVRSFTRDSFGILAAREPELARVLLLDLGRILSIRLRRTSALLSKVSQ